MGVITESVKGAVKAAGKAAKEVPAVVKKRAKPGQTVTDPERMAFPGIYKRPDVIAKEAASMVAPESPSMKELFGVNREELYDISKGMKGNLPGELPGAAARPTGSEAAEKVMNKKNAQRILDVLSEVENHPELVRGMDAWYRLEPLYERMVEVLGPEQAAIEFPRINALMSMASPGSEVTTEIPRGTAAYYLHKQGRFPEFMEHLGKPVAIRQPNLDPEILGVPGHPYHRTAQGLPMQRFLETGEVQMESPKVPMYIQASGVPETGFQTRTPVGDAHWSRAVGLADVRKNKAFGASVSTPEMSQLAPWWREKIAGELGIESVPAQARAWGAFSPQTGVTTPIGAPKLELIADAIMDAAARLDVSPEAARDLWIQGKIRLGGDVGRAEGGEVHMADGGTVELAPHLKDKFSELMQSKGYADGGSVELAPHLRDKFAEVMDSLGYSRGMADGGTAEAWKSKPDKTLGLMNIIKGETLEPPVQHMADGGTPEEYTTPAYDDLSFIGEAVDEDSEAMKKLRALARTGKVIATMAPKAIAAPFVNLYGQRQAYKPGITPYEQRQAGQKYMEEFMQPSESLSAELQADPLAQEYLENISKFTEELETKYKLPPIMPEIWGPLAGASIGTGRQAANLARQGARAVYDKALELPPMPVGLSIQPVGKKTVAQLLEALETGQELTPDEMQRALYSKAQKEKYAQTNLAKVQKEPVQKTEEIKVPANEMGFYSPIEKALANTGRKQGTGEAFLSDIMKFNPSAGELEATGIADWLKGQKSVTKQDILDYLDQNKIQIEEVVRGNVLDDMERQKFNDINRRISRGFQEMVTPEEEAWFEATRAKVNQFKEPRFERENLILPGGKNYKEILLKFPQKEKRQAWEWFDPETQESRSGFATQQEAYDDRPNIGAVVSKVETRDSPQDFRTNHWPDDPNTFLHLRMQDMDIGGKKTLVIEEIQSDWHQEGRVKGYAPQNVEAQLKASEERMRQRGEEIQRISNRMAQVEGNSQEWQRLSKERQRLQDEQGAEIDWGNALYDVHASGVPNAPFKKDWYQLGMKRLMKYAADNDYDQVALVGPEEQIRRGSLGTHVDGLSFEKNSDGSIKLIAEKGNSIVFNETVKPENLELYVGKDVAKKIVASKKADGTLTGEDLQIGGEGMRQYYGRNYPDTMNRLAKKYGVQAQSKQFKLHEYSMDDVESVDTGEVDRFGREMRAYKVTDADTGETIAYEYDPYDAIKEANKKAASTSMWFMELPQKMKSDIKIGQSYKKGGKVKKMRVGGPLVAEYDTIPDVDDSGALKIAAYEQELKNYA